MHLSKRVSVMEYLGNVVIVLHPICGSSYKNLCVY